MRSLQAQARGAQRGLHFVPVQLSLLVVDFHKSLLPDHLALAFEPLHALI